MKKIKKILILLGLFGMIICILVIAINIYVLSFSKTNYCKELDSLEPKYVGLVFGAAVYQNSIPSGILKDRLLVAAGAYDSGKIKKILVSGDNSKTTYNEPEVMKNFLIGEGVKKEDIYMDYAGFDTYDSIYRAKDIFLVNEVVLFTQDFHLKRGMYIAKRLGIDTYGVETNLQPYLREGYYNLREVFAIVKAFLDVEIFHSKPKYLGDTIEIISNERIDEVKKEVLEEG